MPKIIKNGKEYSGVPVEVVTAWAPTADPVQVKEPLMGNTDISSIGDGTVTGAVEALNNDLISKGITLTAGEYATLDGVVATLSGDRVSIRGYAIIKKEIPSQSPSFYPIIQIPSAYTPRNSREMWSIGYSYDLYATMLIAPSSNYLSIFKPSTALSVGTAVLVDVEYCI